MKLTEDQITTIKSWIESGDDLGKIQNQINESFDINLTYLETRFLLSDLKIELNEDEEEEEEQEPVDEPVDEPSAEIQDSENVSENTEEPEQQEPPSGDLEKEETDESAQPTNINVSVDSITQPQCVISGKVTFSDGQLASWWFDSHYHELHAKLKIQRDHFPNHLIIYLKKNRFIMNCLNSFKKELLGRTEMSK